MLRILYVAVGSALGGVARYLVTKIIQQHIATPFPWGTFAVNIIGCLVIGLIYGLADRGLNINADLKLFLTVGFCGGFTTFSTFAHENYLLFDSGNILTVAIYASLSLFAGIVAAYGGHALANLNF